MQNNSWNYKLFHFHLSFWTWLVWKRRAKITKTWISRERKEPFRWNFFIVFQGLSLGEKIKIWWKISDTSFKYHKEQSWSTGMEKTRNFLRVLSMHSKTETYLALKSFPGPQLEAYSEPYQKTKKKCFSKIVNGLAVNYFQKTFHLRCLTGFWNVCH